LWLDKGRRVKYTLLMKVGTGPFRLESWQSDRQLTFVANTGYFGGKPRLERIIMSRYIVVFFTLALADAILIESALSFLGLGLPPDQLSWGTMLADGRAGLTTGNWWAIFFPGLMILLVTLSVNLLGDQLEGRREEIQGSVS
jgi:hypothetical protein